MTNAPTLADAATFETFTQEILVPPEGQLPKGETEEKVLLHGAAQVARAARDAGFTTNGQARLVRTVPAVLVGDEYVPEDSVRDPLVLAGAPRARIMTFEAEGSRLDSPAAIRVDASRIGNGPCIGVIPGPVVAPVLLDVRHELGTLMVRVLVSDIHGRPITPQCVAPITADSVEVVAGAGSCRVVVEVEPEDEPA